MRKDNPEKKDKLTTEIENYIHNEITQRLDEFFRETYSILYTLYSNQLAFATEEQKKKLLIEKNKIEEFKAKRSNNSMDKVINRVYELSKPSYDDNSSDSNFFDTTSQTTQQDFFEDTEEITAQDIKKYSKNIDANNKTLFDDIPEEPKPKPKKIKETSDYMIDTNGRIVYMEEDEEEKRLDEMYGGDDSETFSDEEDEKHPI